MGMANKLIQLTDGTDNLYPMADVEGAWSPQIYDYNTLIKTLTNVGSYVRIGHMVFMWFNVRIDDTLTIGTMLQIRGFPFSNIRILGGNVYIASIANQGGDRTIQFTTDSLYIRPNITGTISGGGWWSAFIVGWVAI